MAILRGGQEDKWFFSFSKAIVSWQLALATIRQPIAGGFPVATPSPNQWLAINGRGIYV